MRDRQSAQDQSQDEQNPLLACSSLSLSGNHQSGEAGRYGQSRNSHISFKNSSLAVPSNTLKPASGSTEIHATVVGVLAFFFHQLSCEVAKVQGLSHRTALTGTVVRIVKVRDVAETIGQ
jgi:hypothetical protein